MISLKSKIDNALKNDLYKPLFLGIDFSGPIMFSVLGSYSASVYQSNSSFLVYTSIFFILFVIYRVVVLLTERKIKKSKEQHEAQINCLKQIVALEEYMRKLVKFKAERFLNFYKNICNDGHDIKSIKERVFDSITQPKEQLRTMCALLYEYFTGHFIPDDESGNVTIMMPDEENDNKKLKFCFFKDRPESHDLDIFCYGRSAAGRAWEKGEMVIIPDKQKELEKEVQDRIYVEGKRDHVADKGSLISYPVFDRELTFDKKNSSVNKENSLICIINISSTKNENFIKENSTHYKKILDSIAERIILENRLKKIKDSVII